MTARIRNQIEYVLYQLGGLTVTVTERNCDACGRANLALEYKSKRRRHRTEVGAVVVCHLCMKDISEDHAEYRELRKSKPS